MSTPQSRPRRRSRFFGGGRRGWPLFWYGLIFFAVGLVITITTYALASANNGGTFIISYGPMVVGAIAMIRGLIDVARLRRESGQLQAGPGWQSTSAAAGVAAGGGFGGGPGGWPGGAGGAGGGGGAPGGWPGGAGGAPSGGGAPGGWSGGAGGAPGGWPGGVSRPSDLDGTQVDFGPAGARSHGRPGASPGLGQAEAAGYGQFGATAASSPGVSAGPAAAPVPAQQPSRQPAAGWYPDPQNPAMLRWWDGQAWSWHTHPRG